MDADRDLYELEDDALTAADRRGLADVAAGRVISHDAVMRWLKTWGTPDELPPPTCGE